MYIPIVSTLSDKSTISIITDGDAVDYIPKNPPTCGRSHVCAQSASSCTSIGGDLTSYLIFKKGGWGGALDRFSTFRGGLLRKRGCSFPENYSFYIKNRLKSKILNGKKSLYNKNVFLCHN